MTRQEELTVFRYRVIQERWKQHLKQQELGDRCHYSKSHMCNIESGRRNPSHDTIHAVAKGLGKDSWQLLKPWKNTPKVIARMERVIQKYHGRLPSKKKGKLSV